MRTRIPIRFGIVCLLVMASGGSALAQGAFRDLLEEALDQRVSEAIEIIDQPLLDALRALEGATGVPFELEARALQAMPYGERTKVSLVLEDVALRPALRQLLNGLGLQSRVTDDHVMIERGPMLERLGRRLTLEEVNTLAALSQTRWSDLQPQPSYRRPNDALELTDVLQTMPGDNAVQQFDALAENSGWLWLVDGERVVFRTVIEDVQARLNRQLSMTYQRAPLDDLLLDLGKRIGVTMHFEPGSLGRIDARERSVDLIQRDQTVRQVLELLCGRTGLEYAVDGAGVHFRLSETLDGSPTRAGAPGRLFRVTVPLDPSGAVDVIVREEDLPAPLRDRLDAALENWFAQQLSQTSTQAVGHATGG